MKVEIKNLKTLKSLSEETLCFTATVYIDGVKACEASNHGQGGCNEYHAVNAEGQKMMDKLEAWAKTQPKQVSTTIINGDKPFEYDLDFDGIIDDAINALEEEKFWESQYKRLLKKCAFFDGKSIRSFTGKNLLVDNVRKYISEKHPGGKLLSDMPKHEAFAMMKSHIA